MKFKLTDKDNRIPETLEEALNERVKQIPHGKVNPKTGAIVLPSSEYDPADDVWDKIHREKYGE